MKETSPWEFLAVLGSIILAITGAVVMYRMFCIPEQLDAIKEELVQIRKALSK